MSQKTLSKWLKWVIVGTGICALAVYLAVVPSYGASVAARNPEFAYRYWPWLIFIWITAVPCFAAMFCGWRIASNIGRDRSFIMDNAVLLKWISWLAAGDAAFFFVGNVLYLALDLSHPGVTLFSLLVVFAGVALSVGAAALSHLVRKAAALQDENDLTI